MFQVKVVDLTEICILCHVPFLHDEPFWHNWRVCKLGVTVGSYRAKLSSLHDV